MGDLGVAERREATTARSGGRVEAESTFREAVARYMGLYVDRGRSGLSAMLGRSDRFEPRDCSYADVAGRPGPALLVRGPFLKIKKQAQLHFNIPRKKKNGRLHFVRDNSVYI
jgi:hypothetical protein